MTGSYQKDSLTRGGGKAKGGGGERVNMEKGGVGGAKKKNRESARGSPARATKKEF